MIIVAIVLLLWGSLLGSRHSAVHPPLLADQFDDENMCPGASDCQSSSNLVSTPSTTSKKLKPNPLRGALFPVPYPDRTDGNVWIDENNRHLKALFTCIELENCGRNQAKGTSSWMLRRLFVLLSNKNHTHSCNLLVVILNSHHFTGALWGWTGGEDIW